MTYLFPVIWISFLAVILGGATFVVASYHFRRGPARTPGRHQPAADRPPTTPAIDVAPAPAPPADVDVDVTEPARTCPRPCCNPPHSDSEPTPLADVAPLPQMPTDINPLSAGWPRGELLARIRQHEAKQAGAPTS